VPLVTDVVPATGEPGDPAVARAAEVLRSGGLVAFPTETVYGLGALALDAAAVERVFRAKGRPSTDPLIAHVPSVDAARRLASSWPALGDRLAERFWPGPLTLLVPRRPEVPDAVTAGGPSVAVRVPAHPVALALLRAVDAPVAAPSANRFGRVSPTDAAHVVDELAGAVELVLDGGPTPLGVESTVVRVGEDHVEVLRPGGVTVEDLAEVVDEVRAPERRTVADHAAAASPGQLLRHYSPATPLVLVEGAPATATAIVEALAAAGVAASVVDLPPHGAAAAPLLYARLRSADRRGATLLLAAAVDGAGLGRAINDRLFRAAHGRVVTDASPATVERVVGWCPAPE
jgi:L-threonylcarbamoyladenylate synthase